MQIGVIGGLTMDLFYKVSEFPQKNHAVEAQSYFLSPGGKGLNIATAVRRFGEDVFLVSSVGKDNLSEEIFEHLAMENISQDGILVQENIQTDLITVIVPTDSKPGFIGTRAANFYLTPEDIDRLSSELRTLKVIIVTMEIPLQTVKKSLTLAKENNVLSILNPSPVDEFSSEVLELTDYFILNEYEAYALSKKNTRKAQIEYFTKNSVTKVIITEGEKGCSFWNGQHLEHIPAFKVQAVDATGAGDAFCGIFASAILTGFSENDAIIRASAGGALVAARRGSGFIIPTKEEIEAFLKKE